MVYAANPFNAMFDRFNLWRAIAPESYANTTYGALGYVPPDMAMQYLMAQNPNLYRQLNGNLAAAMGRSTTQPVASFSDRQLEQALGAGYATHQAGNVSVHVGSSGKVMFAARSKEEGLGALVTVRDRLKAGDPDRVAVEKAISSFAAGKTAHVDRATFAQVIET